MTCLEVKRFRDLIWCCENLSWRHEVFRDRVDAGTLLAGFTRRILGSFRGVVVGLAAGGIPVACSMARELGVEFDLVVIKKITFPWTTEAGFGAVALDGTLYYDARVAREIGYSSRDVERIASSVREYVINRTLRLRGDTDYSNLRGREVILVDDGIATGYTMIVAIRFLRSRGVSRVIVATPTSSLDGALRVSRENVEILILNLRDEPFYAVAEAYREWHDVEDEEALNFIKMCRDADRQPLSNL
ncbi:MAG: phosphoribosyltransferase family protein [Sulfolobales archaeon]